jgi:branched-chain amino acid transport system substrate-binding protein
MKLSLRLMCAELVALLTSCAIASYQPVCAEVGVQENEILIGTANTLSGPSAFVGKEMNIGFQAYIDHTNDHGGIYGRKIRLISCDDRYETDGALACFKDLIDKKVFGITGCYGAALITKYIPLAMHAKIPLVGFSSGPIFAVDPVKRYVFTIRPDFVHEERQVIEKLWTEGNFHRFAVIYQNDSYGSQILNGAQETLKSHNADVVGASSYNRNSDVPPDAFDLVKKANPEIVILGAVQKPAAEILQMASNANWHPIFLLNSGSAVDEFVSLAGPDAEGVLVTEVMPPYVHNDLPLVKQYRELLKKYYPNEKPNFTSLRGYSNAVLWVEGLKRAGKDLTREKFVDALESIHNWDQGLGKTMEVSFSPTKHVGRTNLFYCIVKNGEVITLKDWASLKPKSK